VINTPFGKPEVPEEKFNNATVDFDSQGCNLNLTISGAVLPISMRSGTFLNCVVFCALETRKILSLGIPKVAAASMAVFKTLGCVRMYLAFASFN